MEIPAEVVAAEVVSAEVVAEEVVGEATEPGEWRRARAQKPCGQHLMATKLRFSRRTSRSPRPREHFERERSHRSQNEDISTSSCAWTQWPVSWEQGLRSLQPRAREATSQS